MSQERIKVVMMARPNLYKVPGGDTIQIAETAKALRLLNVVVDVIIEGDIDYEQYDVVHFFNVITPEDILGHIYKLKIPYVISTIYVNYREYDRYHRKDLIGKLSQLLPANSIEYIKTVGKYLLKGERVSTNSFFIKGHKNSIQFILKNSAMLLPNSENEYQRLLADYKIPKKYIVIPNAIDNKLFIPTYTLDFFQRNVILCVARIEGNKNQLNVIRALKNTSYKIIFIGKAAPNHLQYYNQCRHEATKNMEFIDFMPQYQLLDYYQKARVHILASWFETTGLSNLEAAAMGCSLVVGDRGDVREYLGNDATYCEPGDLISIKDAVDNAWKSKPNSELQKRIIANFNWSITAQKTHEAYTSVLSTFSSKY